MRAREILEENYTQSLETDLNNLLVGAKGSGANEINTEDLVAQLRDMGYAVDSNSIMRLLSINPIVLNATPTVIRLDSAGPTGSTGATDDSAAQVSDMAQQATKIG